MPILNYTTQISTEKTVGEIQRILAKAKASSVLTEFDPEACVRAISFRITTTFGVMSFRLPANVDAIQKILQRERIGLQRLRSREQAARVAWRIIKDWLEAQLALVAAGMADIQQVLLPYMQDDNGQTVYEALQEKHFEGLALPLSSKE